MCGTERDPKNIRIDTRSNVLTTTTTKTKTIYDRYEGGREKNFLNIFLIVEGNSYLL